MVSAFALTAAAHSAAVLSAPFPAILDDAR